jgi:thiamine transporter
MVMMVLARRHQLVRLTEAAIAVALSVLLGNVRLVELPNGGSIALATLPLLALALTRGFRVAFLAGACAGAAHALAGGTVIHPVQLLLDYLLAYSLLATAGLGTIGAARGRAQLVLPVVAAMALHLAAMVVSGVVFFAPVAGSAALMYSLGYNASTVVPETVLALWLLPPLVRALARANPADSWRRGLLPPPVVHPRTPRPIHAPTPIDTTLTSTFVTERPDSGPFVTNVAPPATLPTTFVTDRPDSGPSVTNVAARPAPAARPRATLVRAAPFARRRSMSCE